MRVFAIETVYRSRGSKTPGIDGVTLSKEKLHYYLNTLRENNLLKYKTSFYIDSKPFEKWSTNMFKLRNVGKTSNNWSELYKQQKGICVACGGSLGYLLEENLEIHHINQVSKWDSSKKGGE
jgi:hypothetical protein